MYNMHQVIVVHFVHDYPPSTEMEAYCFCCSPVRARPVEQMGWSRPNLHDYITETGKLWFKKMTESVESLYTGLKKLFETNKEIRL